MKKRAGALFLSLVIVITMCISLITPAQAGSGLAIIISPTSKTMYIGNKARVKMYVGGTVSKAAGWSSSNKSVATVSSNGVVTAKGTGKTVITCKTGYGFNLTCNITVKKRKEISGVLNKNYTYLAKKASNATYLNKSQDPAGIGNLYVFKTKSGSDLFFRYDLKTLKPTSLQISSLSRDSHQKALSLYGVYVEMGVSAAKTALKSTGWKYSKKETLQSGDYSLYYKKNGHTIMLRIQSGKVGWLQWSR